MQTSADLCCEGYLLGEYMLPSLFGPMLFWLPGGPMFPSIPITWSGLQVKQQVNHHAFNKHQWHTLYAKDVCTLLQYLLML